MRFDLALRLPDAEGVACAGTSLESRTITADGKAFLFLRDTELRLKLRDSLPEIAALVTAEPERCQTGAHGWVTIQLPAPLNRLAAWTERASA